MTLAALLCHIVVKCAATVLVVGTAISVSNAAVAREVSASRLAWAITWVGFADVLAAIWL